MDSIIAIAVDEQVIYPHELVIVTETEPDFLPRATLARSEGRSALLYSKNDLIPFAFYAKGRDKMDLGAIFSMLNGYIRCLIAARDRMLNTDLVSSDPEKGVFIVQEGDSIKVKTVWGMDTVADEHEKICRISETLSKCGRVMGAEMSMKRMTEIIRSENLSLKNCLAAAERINREWNRIVSPDQNLT